MKKRIFAIVAALLMASAPMMAQVFLDDEELLNSRAGNNEPSMYVDNPHVYNSGEDWYAPVGEGLIVLAGLSGAYLLGKRKHND